MQHESELDHEAQMDLINAEREVECALKDLETIVHNGRNDIGLNHRHQPVLFTDVAALAKQLDRAQRHWAKVQRRHPRA